MTENNLYDKSARASWRIRSAAAQAYGSWLYIVRRVRLTNASSAQHREAFPRPLTSPFSSGPWGGVEHRPRSLRPAARPLARTARIFRPSYSRAAFCVQDVKDLFLVRPAGLEPAARVLGGRRSILSELRPHPSPRALTGFRIPLI